MAQQTARGLYGQVCFISLYKSSCGKTLLNESRVLITWNIGQVWLTLLSIARLSVKGDLGLDGGMSLGKKRSGLV